MRGLPVKVGFRILAGAALALAAAPAWADSGWYLSGSVGGYFRESENNASSFFHADNPSFKVPGTVTRSFDPGVIGNIAVGYTVIPQVRVEAEIGYGGYTTSTLNPLAHNVNFPRLNGSPYAQQSGDDWTRFTGTLNAFYDIMPIAGITPYIGLGLGAAADNKSRGVFTRANGDYFTSTGGSGTEGLGLIEAGISLPVADNLALTASYRYVHFFDDGEDIAHIVKMGIRYTF
jgi:opacity protein-like surface antigen